MKGFLHQLAFYLSDKYGADLGKQCLVFPNRRSGLYFKHYLVEASLRSAWMPEILTIRDFIEDLSGLRYADPVDVNFEVYRAYTNKVQEPESYDEFYFWGEMMVSDFNDVDKYMIGAGDLFSNVKDLKEIDQIFDYLTEEQKEVIRRFWGSFQGAGLSNEQESFLHFWRIIPAVYEDLRKNLKRQDLGYEGMLYREVAEKIRAEQFPEIQHDHVIIIGFNALSKAEEIIFDYLRNSGKGDFYWDYDVSFVKNNSQEAGRFMRRNIERYPMDDYFLIGHDHLKDNKTIRIYSLPSDTLQTKQLGKILDEKADQPESVEKFDDTAVIFGDELLLLPALTSLPEGLQGINITMGYPLAKTPVYSFVESLLQLQRNAGTGRSKWGQGYYFRDVLRIVNHQYVRAVLDEDSIRMVNDINRKNLIYVGQDFFRDHPLFEQIFRKCTSAAEIGPYLQDVLSLLHDTKTGEEDESSAQLFEKEYIFQLKTRLNKLQEIVERHLPAMTPDTYHRLFKKVLENYRIPFETEPLQNIQMMGILESRLLDFRHLVFLSMNEGIMPGSSRSNSFIPPNLRYASGMPTQEDKDAIYAYYFYRLLQRAEQVDLMYNSKAEGLRSGEPTRYIYQLRYLHEHPIDMKTVSFRITEQQPKAIVIPKSKALMEKLMEFSGRGSRKLSPSALTGYLDCPLRFYFSYVMKIREEDEVKEDLDAAGFGSLLHKVMEKIYETAGHKMVSEEDLKTMAGKKVVEQCINEAFLEEYKISNMTHGEFRPQGRNIIVYEIIRKMVQHILALDDRFTPFRVRELEKDVDFVYPHPEVKEGIRLGGIIDRLDESNGAIRIIDYKTGKANRDMQSLEQLFTRDRWGKKTLKGAFQTLLYSWFYEQTEAPGMALTPGLYVTSEIMKKDYSPSLEINKVALEDFRSIKEEFESRLNNLLKEIFHPEIPFAQTEDEKRCGYCPYTDICHRKKGRW